MSRQLRRFHAKRKKLLQLNRAYSHSPRWALGLYPYDHPARWWKHGIHWYPISHTPSWWIREMHTVKQRAQERMVCESIMCGRTDPDAAIFPTARRPHIY